MKSITIRNISNREEACRSIFAEGHCLAAAQNVTDRVTAHCRGMRSHPAVLPKKLYIRCCLAPLQLSKSESMKQMMFQFLLTSIADNTFRNLYNIAIMLQMEHIWSSGGAYHGWKVGKSICQWPKELRKRFPYNIQTAARSNPCRPFFISSGSKGRDSACRRSAAPYTGLCARPAWSAWTLPASRVMNSGTK